MYNHIMVPLDGSELAECVLPHVDSVAGGCALGKVTLIRVVSPFHLYGSIEHRISPEERHRLDERGLAVAREYLEEKARSLQRVSVPVECVVRLGEVVHELTNFAGTQGVDLIIISTHGRSGVSRWVWGSVADRILRSACVPVLMVRAPGCFPGI
ncbi:MAG: universal stress protein [Chloroflexi bacterium]|nr:universal stress protein [Chloroflexota bacterium]